MAPPDLPATEVAPRESRYLDILKLAIAMGVGKVVVLAAAYLARPVPNFLYLMSTRWDAAWFVTIANWGYTARGVLVYSPTSHTTLYPSAFAFSPFYPYSIHAVSALVGPAWVSALLIANVLSFLVPIVAYEAFGFKAALMLELFPTYLVYTTIPYSEALTLLFLTLAVLFALRGKLLASSASISLAVFAAYTTAWMLPSFAIAFWRRIRWKTLLFFALPALTGVLILGWLQKTVGSYTFFFTVESLRWHVAIGYPWDQAAWLLQRDAVPFWPFAGTWVTRNLPFEAFYVIGAALLLKARRGDRVFLSVFSFSAILPLFFVLGGPGEAIPRLLLPAFPIFAAYADRFGRRLLPGYAIVCLLLAVWAATSQTLGFFS